MDLFSILKNKKILLIDDDELIRDSIGFNELFSETVLMGIDEFLEKPFTSETLETSLSRLIENRSQLTGKLQTEQFK